MTDKKPEIQQASQAAAPAATSSPGPSTSAATAKKGQAAGKPRSVFLPAFLIVLLIALALAAGLWYQQRLLDETRPRLAGQVHSRPSAAKQAVEQAQKALSREQTQIGKTE